MDKRLSMVLCFAIIVALTSCATATRQKINKVPLKTTGEPSA